ncbi:hypothetical protein [Qingshengfaniella alkalisoli]|uniref:Uncharacterized protein n=1 Tax=Qingshengfaniella alkalisoli TaxID=2599296 RepID=A0A5B8J0E9_9RHOB|nr:hypothetical protein [Qingshengfaniella alkalisoli]QDY71374.1 hypothetical protein FPZ52_16885 [Qingshengfaniella alkalisoli]
MIQPSYPAPQSGSAGPVHATRTRLHPAMSLLEIILQIIAEIIEDFLCARRSEVARDASIAAALAGSTNSRMIRRSPRCSRSMSLGPPMMFEGTGAGDAAILRDPYF